MAKVIINGKVVEIEPGVRFGELHHEIEKAGVEFGCTDGQCGVCVCTILSGLECVEEPSEIEEETLWRIGEYEENRRLTCQLVLKGQCPNLKIETD
ncbi:MAG: (2Fe-2S)-binding protein [Aquificaceae bacterium]|nr:(2Fe-2S)-binding protein [Aquificaceae bacterium]MDW8236838.1 2Fe-2S iron-sulfur cluster-binding protein [Aquificaceae bacterium]